MAQRKTTAKKPAARKRDSEKDSAYLLKLVLYLVIGSLWLRVSFDDTVLRLPFGLLIGLAFVMHEHFRIDRKIEFAVLLIAALIGFVTRYDLYIMF